jgi:hypothetical protein
MTERFVKREQFTDPKQVWYNLRYIREIIATPGDISTVVTAVTDKGESQMLDFGFDPENMVEAPILSGGGTVTVVYRDAEKPECEVHEYEIRGWRMRCTEFRLKPIPIVSRGCLDNSDPDHSIIAWGVQEPDGTWIDDKARSWPSKKQFLARAKEVRQKVLKD